MKKLWRWNSGISVSQLAVFIGLLFAPLAEQGKYTVALALTGVVTFIALLLVTFTLLKKKFGVAIWFTIFAAFLGVMALTLVMISEFFLSGVIFVVMLVVAYLVPSFAMDDDTITAPRWAYVVTALPLGVGAIAGRILLLVYGRNSKKGTESEPSVIPWPGSDTSAEP